MSRKQAGGPRVTSNGSLKRWNTRDDIPDDEQDAFHRQQDKVIFGDDQAEMDDEDDEYGALAGEREILDVDEESPDSDSDVEDEEDEENDESGEEGEDEQFRHPSKVSSGKKASVPFSDDEDEHEEDPDDAPTGGWGPNKQSYYSTNDLDDLSSDSEMDEEERRELEVREVKKLQGKSRQGMIDEDFGLSQDTLRHETSAAAREARKRELDLDTKARIATEPTKVLEYTSLDPTQRAEMLSKVQKATPETLALVGEYADIVEEIDVVSNRLTNIVKDNIQQEIIGLCYLHHQTLLTYAANLSFYFYLRATPFYAQSFQKLASHGVIGRLLKLKTGLQLLENYGFAADEELSEEDDDSIEEDENEENRAPQPSFLFKAPILGGASDEEDEYSESLGSLEDDELMQLDREERDSLTGTVDKTETRPVKEKKMDIAKERVKKRKDKSEKKVSAPLAHVADLDDEDDSLGALKKRKKSHLKAPNVSTDAEAFNAFGEQGHLSASDSADKEAKRKSLKFYTGQIDARDARKAGGSGLGGDSDIPYRDRERSRTAVANANARKTAGGGNRDLDRGLDGDDWNEDDSRDWRDVMDVEQTGKIMEDQGDDSMDYYDLVASGKKSAKRAKKEDYDEARASQRIAPDNDDLEDGQHRGINRTIEKNRGLTPRRPKSVRNPRVKKRLRYEKAKKQLSSRGPVYKGGQGALEGGYSGEKSGINSHVVKSRQFA